MKSAAADSRGSSLWEKAAMLFCGGINVVRSEELGVRSGGGSASKLGSAAFHYKMGFSIISVENDDFKY